MTNEYSYGALVYRFRNNKRQFLLVKHINGGHIGMPKGHIEKGEEPIETAYREVFEETGIKTFIYPEYQSITNFQPKENVHKEVTYFIGRPMNDDIKYQTEEVSKAYWCDESNVEKEITFAGDRAVFKQLYQEILTLEEGVDVSLYSYVETHILPQYDSFDEGHHRDHIYEVVKVSFELIKRYKAKKDMVYLVACFHDLGLQFGRKTHHVTSGDLLKKDAYVLSHYNVQDIETMVDAIFDHRASNAHEPRTIYGLILAEADRLLDVKKVIDRTVLYELHKHPELSREGQIKNAFDHIIDKYGNHGYLKRYLDYEPNRVGEQALIDLSNDETVLYQKLNETFEKLCK